MYSSDKINKLYFLENIYKYFQDKFVISKTKTIAKVLPY